LVGEKNPHRLEVERHREGLEEVVADHACEMEAERVFSRPGKHVATIRASAMQLLHISFLFP
jgi:hypothetical protein